MTPSLAARIGACLLPFVVEALYLWLLRPATEPWRGWGDHIASWTGLGVGVLAVLHLPFRWWMRLSLLVPYVPVVGFLMFIEALILVAWIYGDTL